jgi:hypothetical protein
LFSKTRPQTICSQRPGGATVCKFLKNKDPGGGGGVTKP